MIDNESIVLIDFDVANSISLNVAKKVSIFF